MRAVDRLRKALAGRYEIGRQIGSGGMAVVYRATDLTRGRDVAMKVMRPEFAASIAAERFRREVEITTRLRHPFIIPPHESGSHDGILWYAMPHVMGDTLRERLRKERQLPVAEAIAIVRDVAAALAHAHEQGVVHRDIKPENILIADGHAYVSDFGIARALNEAERKRLTSSGVAIGTAEYMSPEQAGGQREIDARSDIYALGCLLHEMLAGEPPFTGPTRQAIAAKHLSLSPPSVRVVRAAIPEFLAESIQRCLAKSPADRFQSVGEFVETLDTRDWESTRASGSRRRLADLLPSRVSGLVLGSMALAVMAVGLPRARNALPWLLVVPELDSALYALLPPIIRSGATEVPGFAPRLRASLGQWTDITLADNLQTQDAVVRVGGTGPSSGRSLRVAASLGARWFVHTEIVGTGDSLEIHMSLNETARRARVVHRTSVRVPTRDPPSDSLINALAESILFGTITARTGLPREIGTRSVTAVRLYSQAQSALEAWDLATADSLFTRSAAQDPSFAAAGFWSAQVKNWRGISPAEWRARSVDALRAVDSFPERERLLIEGLALLATGDFPRACGVYERATTLDDRDFAGWYGLGECRRMDAVVLRSSGSETGWAFRGSRHRAMEAYRRALTAVPLSHLGFRDRSFAGIRGIFLTSPTDLVFGRSLEGDERFLGYPVWNADTLAVIPYSDGTAPLWASYLDALAQQRQLFRTVALTWVREFPESPDALHALALSEEMLGDPTSALLVIQRARSLLPAAAPGLALGSAEVRLRYKLAIPDSLERLVDARRLADSLLSQGPTTTAYDASILSELAALLGRPTQAAAFARLAIVDQENAPVTRATGALTAFAAIGYPATSIAHWEGEVESAVRRYYPSAVQDFEIARRAGYAAVLAFGSYTSKLIRDSAPFLSPQLEAQAALWHGEPNRARQILFEIQGAREGLPREDVSVDMVFAEAFLLRRLGEQDSAQALLDGMLTRLARVQPENLSETGRAGPLVRAMAVRAELAAAEGDIENARRWAGVVLTLWEGGEDAVEPLIDSMATIVRGSREAIR